MKTTITMTETDIQIACQRWLEGRGYAVKSIEIEAGEETCDRTGVERSWARVKADVEPAAKKD